MDNKITLEVEANVAEDAKWVLNRQERMEKQRLDFLANLYKYTAYLVLTCDEDEADEDEAESD